MENNRNPHAGICKKRILCVILLLLSIPVVIYFCSSQMFKYQALLDHYLSFLRRRTNLTKGGNGDILIVERKTLEEALAEVAIDNMTAIITFLSQDDVKGQGKDRPIFDVFLDGFRHGEDTLNLRTAHLLIVAVDKKAYRRCKFVRRHCYLCQNCEYKFGDPDDFSTVTGGKTSFLREVLKFGYNFIFTETDVLWLRKPIPKLLLGHSENKTIDLQFSVDKFNGYRSSSEGLVNIGFYMVRSNNNTIALFEEWDTRIILAMSTNPWIKEQDVLRMMMKEGLFKKLGLKVRFLDTLYFSGFCEDSKYVRDVVTVHANCCRTTRAKVKDLTTVIEDWNKFKSSPDAPFKWSKHNNCKGSRKELL